jgi:glycosyltransferase involved in cell wall biosynthesis
MERPKPKVFIFGWPSFVGGADTKLHHLMMLLHEDCDITLVPSHPRQLHQRLWTSLMEKLGVKYCRMEDLPPKLEGVALGLCNPRFFKGGIAHRAKEMGLKIVWSSEMMWHFEGEHEAVKDGIIDHFLYVSEFQREALLGGSGGIPGTITGNYIDPGLFPVKQRDPRRMVIGRLSRPDPDKFPEDFPVFYECLELRNARFRVMAWSPKLAEKYRWHHFDDRWDLLRQKQEPQEEFLQSLDLFMYPLGHRFRESWGRATVEAMLTGCIPFVPKGHFFDSLIVHGKSGFICGDFLEYQENARMLAEDPKLRREMSMACRHHAEKELCDRQRHRELWLNVFRSQEN